MSVGNAPAIGLLTYCVNNADVTDSERVLLRDMLAAATRGALRDWGMANQRRADEVHRLFEKIKGQLNA